MKPYFQRQWPSKISDLAQEVGDISQEVSDIAQEVSDIAQEEGNLAQEMQLASVFEPHRKFDYVYKVLFCA